MRCSRLRREETVQSDAPFGREAIGGVRSFTKCDV